MRFYLSARFARKAELNGYRHKLEALGHTNVSSWLDGDPPGFPAMAIENLKDVHQADVLLAFSEEPCKFSRVPFAVCGGRHVETGIALGLGVWVLVVGPRENVFHHHPNVQQVDDFARAVDGIEFVQRWWNGGADPDRTARK